MRTRRIGLTLLVAFTFSVFRPGPVSAAEPGLSLVPGHAYSAPYEDVKLKRP